MLASSSKTSPVITFFPLRMGGSFCGRLADKSDPEFHAWQDDSRQGGNLRLKIRGFRPSQVHVGLDQSVANLYLARFFIIAC
jgi:hypothetical protein